MRGLEGLAIVYVVGLISLCVWPIAARAGGWRPNLILSNSMAPAVLAGDVLVSAPVAANAVRLGEVVVVRDPSRKGALLAHRLVDRDTDGALVTKGDANRSRDSTPIDGRDLVGVVRIAVPKVGLPALWLQQRELPRFVGWLVLNALALLVASRAVRPWSTRRLRAIPTREFAPRTAGRTLARARWVAAATARRASAVTAAAARGVERSRDISWFAPVAALGLAVALLAALTMPYAASPGPARSGSVALACSLLTSQGWIIRPRRGAPGTRLAARRSEDAQGGALFEGRERRLTGAWSEVAQTSAGPSLALRVVAPLTASITVAAPRAPAPATRVFPCGGR